MPDTLIAELKDPEALKALTEVITVLLDRWGIHEANQAALLNVPDISKFKRGEPLPRDQAVLERAGHLIAVDRVLKTLHPYTPTSRNRWVSSAQAELNGKSPLQIMLVNGVGGMKRVRELLDTKLNSRYC